MEVIRLGGTDRRLYELVAPLVMNPAIIRQNNGYPFKTSAGYVWYIAVENGTVEGFMPLRKNSSGMLIDNYYIRGDSAQTIYRLLDSISAGPEGALTLTATVFKRHVDMFKRRRFRSAVEWKNYDKMTLSPPKHKEDGETTERV